MARGPGCFSACFRAEDYPLRDGSPQHERLMPYLLQHGRHAMAFSTLQPGLRHFLVDGMGYIAYSVMTNGPNWMGITNAVVLAEPIAAPEHWRELTQRFLDTQRRMPVFLQVGREYGAVLAQLGLRVNCLGGEVELAVGAWSVSSKARRGIRSAVNAAQRAGLTVEEVQAVDATLAAEMAAVDEAWGSAKGGRALSVWLLNRLPQLHEEPGVRKFLVRGPDQGLQAFVFFDPMWADGTLAGYYANVTRMRPDAHPGCLNLLIKTAMDTLREGHCAAQKGAQATGGAGTAATPGGKKRAATRRKSQQDKLPTVDSGSGTGGGGGGGVVYLSAAPGRAVTAAPLGEQGEAQPPAASSGQSPGQRRQQLEASSAAHPPSPPPPPAAPSRTVVTAAAAAQARLVVSLGMAPLCALREDAALNPNRHMARQLAKGFTSTVTAAFYPYQQVALSKCRYGGHLNPESHTFSDASATWRPVYLAHGVHGGRMDTFVKLFDISKHLGFYDGPADSTARLLRHQSRRTLQRVRAHLTRRQDKGLASGDGGDAAAYAAGDGGGDRAAAGTPACR